MFKLLECYYEMLLKAERAKFKFLQFKNYKYEKHKKCHVRKSICEQLKVKPRKLILIQ